MQHSNMQHSNMHLEMEKDLWNAKQYVANCNFVPLLGNEIVQNWLQPEANEAVLDVGCGDGTLTKQIKYYHYNNNHDNCGKNCGNNCGEKNRKYGIVDVYGIDSSSSMIEHARNVNDLKKTAVLDAQRSDLIAELQRINYDVVNDKDEKNENMAFPVDYDAVFSNAAIHWMGKDPAQVVRNAHSLLSKKKGRFVAEFGGKGNIATIVSALIVALNSRGYDDAEEYIPFYFPSVEEYKGLLESNGFKVKRIELFHRPTILPEQTGIMGWMDAFATPLLNIVKTSAEREEIKEMVAKGLKFSMFDKNHHKWFLDYVRLRVAAEPL